MKHTYKSGVDLFGSHYVSFRITFQHKKYGSFEYFGSRLHLRDPLPGEKFLALRLLARTKHKILKNIAIIRGSQKSIQILKKHKL